MNEILKDFKQFEKIYSQQGDVSFEIFEGKSKIMISAPHVVTHERMGKTKFAEPQTGAIALILNKYCGCPVIIKRKNMGDDANYDLKSEYKTALKNYIEKNDVKFLIDLHQLSSKRKVMIDLGTGKGKNLEDEKLIEIFAYFFKEIVGEELSIDNPFAGAMNYTISSFVKKKCGIFSCQLEINSQLVYEEFEKSNIENICKALIEIVRNLEEKLNNEGC